MKEWLPSLIVSLLLEIRDPRSAPQQYNATQRTCVTLNEPQLLLYVCICHLESSAVFSSKPHYKAHFRISFLGWVNSASYTAIWHWHLLVMEPKKAPSHGYAPSATPGLSRNNTPSSVVSRVKTSASELAKEALFHPHPGAIVNELSSAILDNGKGSSSSAFAGPSAMPQSLQDIITTDPSVSQDGSSSLAHHGFRSKPPSWRTLATSDDFNSFLSLQGQDKSDLQQPEYPPSLPPLQHIVSHADSPGRVTATPSTLVSLASEGSDNHRSNSNPADGAAVVDLLSDPCFCVGDVADFAAGCEDASGYYSTPAKSLARQVSLDIAHSAKPLSLIPDFQRCSESTHVSEVYSSQVLTAIHGNQADISVPKVQLERDFEVQPWVEILTTYHDEVWRDGLPLIEAARVEANAIRNGEDGRRKHCPAIQRLAMLLGHIGSGVRD